MHNPPSEQRPRRHLIGLGLDHDDGHKRLTRAEDFTILGGSEETHERMTEVLLKTRESLQNEGRTLENAPPEALAEWLSKHAERAG